MKVKVRLESPLSHVGLFPDPMDVAHQVPLPMGFSSQECWSDLPFPSPGDLPDPGKEPGSPALQADSLPTAPPGKPWNSEAGAEKAGMQGRDKHKNGE